MRVLALTRYTRRGASSRLRFEQFVPHLATEGIEVVLAPLLDDRFLAHRYAGRGQDVAAIARAYGSRALRLLRSEPWDLVWLEKEAFPWLPGWVERALARPEAPVVVDFDDAWFHRYDQHPRPWVRALLAGKLDGVMRRASVVCAGNEYIADHARRAGAARVEIVPTVVDVSRYPAGSKGPSGPLTVGWIGTPLTAHYLHAIGGALAEVSARIPLRLRAIGAGALELPGVTVETPAWSESQEPAAIAACDLGVMPLPDSPWERGKCGYKLIQFMACGKPVVASPVGVNRTLVRDGENGFLAGDPGAWVRALVALHDDRDRGAAMGAAGRRLVESSYDVRVQAPRLARILRSAAAPRGSR